MDRERRPSTRGRKRGKLHAVPKEKTLPSPTSEEEPQWSRYPWTDPRAGRASTRKTTPHGEVASSDAMAADCPDSRALERGGVRRPIIGAIEETRRSRTAIPCTWPIRVVDSSLIASQVVCAAEDDDSRKEEASLDGILPDPRFARRRRGLQFLCLGVGDGQGFLDPGLHALRVGSRTRACCRTDISRPGAAQWSAKLSSSG